MMKENFKKEKSQQSNNPQSKIASYKQETASLLKWEKVKSSQKEKGSEKNMLDSQFINRPKFPSEEKTKSTKLKFYKKETENHPKLNATSGMKYFPEKANLEIDSILNSIFVLRIYFFSLRFRPVLKIEKKNKSNPTRKNLKKLKFLVLTTLLLLAGKARSEITILDSTASPGTILTFDRESEGIIYADRRISKIPTEEKSYLIYVSSADSSDVNNKNYLERVNFGTKNLEVLESEYLFHFEFLESNSNKYVFHQQANKESTSVFGFGSFDSTTKQFTTSFSKTVDTAPHPVITGFSRTFAYSKISNFFMFCKMTASSTCQITAGELQEESNWKIQFNSLTISVAPSFFLVDGHKAHSTHFAVVNYNSDDEFLNLYDYSQGSLVSTTLATKAQMLSGSTKYEITPSMESSNYLGIVYITGLGGNEINFRDVSTKTSGTTRKVILGTAAAEIGFFLIFGVKSTNFFVVQGISTDAEGISTHYNYVVDNHNGENDIEFLEIDKAILTSKSSTAWYYSGGYYTFFEATEYGEIIIHGYRVTEGDKSEKFEMSTFQLLDFVCHPTCGATGCLESGRKSKCKDCSDTPNMDKTGSESFTCACKSTHSFFDLTSKKCVETCSKNEVTLQDGVKYCLTDDECKAKKLYPTTTGDSKKICVTWKQCSESGKYFDVVNSVCEPNLDSKPTLVSYKSGSANFGVDQNFCVGVKGMKIFRKYCIKTCTAAETPFYYPQGATCLSQADCEGKAAGSKIYLSYSTDQEKVCITKEECNLIEGDDSKIMATLSNKKTCILKSECSTKSGKYVLSSNECVSNCPETDKVQSLDGNTCYSQTNCPLQNDPKKYLVSLDESTSLCLTDAECKSDARSLFNTEDNVCKKSGDCKLVDGADAGTCVTNCPQTNPYYLSSDNTCYSDTNCKEKNAENVLFTDSNSKKFCITKEVCKAKGAEYLLEVADRECIKATSCSKIKITSTQECSASCSLFLNQAGDDCYTQAECTGLNGDTYYPAVGESGQQNYCFKDSECKAHAEFLMNIASPNSCIKKSACSQTFKVGGECRSDCAHYLNNAGDSCLLEGECTAGKLKAVPVSGAKYCLTVEECKSKNGFLLRKSDNTCIDESKCDKDGTEEYWIVATGECSTTCTDYLDKNELKCYTSTACTSISGDVSYYVAGDSGDTKKFCLSQDECKAKSGFVWDTDKCVKSTKCSEDGKFPVEGEGICNSSCGYYLDQTEKICLTENDCTTKENKLVLKPKGITDQKRCFSSDECKTAGNLIKGSECLTKSQCKDQKFRIDEENKACVSKCQEDKPFHKDQICLDKCPTGEFGQQGTNECVKESECESVKLTDGTNGKGKGDSKTGKCDFEVEIDQEVISKNENYDVNKESGEVKLKYNPREKKMKGVENKILILLPFDFTIFIIPAERLLIVKNVILIIQGKGRILQDETVSHEVIISEDDPKEGYVAFTSPSDQTYKAKVNFDTEKEFSTKLGDGSEKKIKIGLKDLTYEVPQNDGSINQIINGVEEPSGIFGIFTAAYDVYFRLVSPFFGPSFQVFTSQNYQRTTLLSHLAFWKIDKNDWLFVKTYKDWISEGGSLIASDKTVDEGAKDHCDGGRLRFCFYKKTHTLLTAGLGGLILMGILLIGLVVGVVLDKKKGKVNKVDDISRRKQESTTKNVIISDLILYKFFPKGIFVLQTNFLFYCISSIPSLSYDLVSFCLSLTFLAATVGLIIFSLVKKSSLNLYYKRVYQENFEDYSKIWIIAGFIYDFLISILIVSLPTEPLAQSGIFFVLEIAYTVLTLILNKKLFDKKFLILLLIGQRSFFVLDALIAALTSIIKPEQQKTWNMFCFIISSLSVIFSIILTVVIILKNVKKGKSVDKGKKEIVAKKVEVRENNGSTGVRNHMGMVEIREDVKEEENSSRVKILGAEDENNFVGS